MKYKRILLKLSGEALSSKNDSFDIKVINELVDEIKEVYDTGVEIAIVCGGGNFVRGKSLANLGIPREKADSMGMLGTVMNALALETVLNKKGVKSKAFSTLEMPQVIDPYRHEEVLKCLENKEVVIFACGVGHPYFSTDTGCALRATQIRADIVLLAKNGVDGCYDDDPCLNPHAKKFHQITYDEMIARDLKVIDGTATTLLKENQMKAYIFDMSQRGNIIKIVQGEEIGTLIH